MKYIIQHGIKIDNHENKTINVLNPKEICEYVKNGYKYKERLYQLTLRHSQYEVICAEIWQKDDKEHTLIIPAFHIPGRPYCLHVYAYAINLYSTNPEIGQRAAAEKTRKQFDLKTFAHTTLGRALKTLAKMFTETELSNNDTAVETREDERTSVKHGSEMNAEKVGFKYLQKEQDIKLLRELVKKFFYTKEKYFNPRDFKEVCELISNCWNAAFNRLLL